jgi:hypothetical protein
MIVGIVIAAYLALDPGRIAKGMAVRGGDAVDLGFDLLRQAQFFLLEAGFLGFVILAISRSKEVVLALVILLLLPIVRFGPGNDLVMRASIPSLALLAIASVLALTREGIGTKLVRKKVLLGCLLAVGAVTPIQEFARAAILRAWPANLDANLIGANCGVYPAHYIARLWEQKVKYLMRQPHRIPLDFLGRQSCDNPAIDLMWRRGLL